MFYGQLKYIFVINIPSLTIGEISLFDEPTTIAFGAINQCQITQDHPSLDIHYFQKMGSMDVVDVTMIQCLVARTQWNGSWAIFDRSGPLAGAVPKFED
jgi:hypothetical protein